MDKYDNEKQNTINKTPDKENDINKEFLLDPYITLSSKDNTISRNPTFGNNWLSTIEKSFSVHPTNESRNSSGLQAKRGTQNPVCEKKLSQYQDF